jgi:hypothetical protein
MIIYIVIVVAEYHINIYKIIISMNFIGNQLNF